jgi:phosphoribosylglycinamide formyltransferase-1
MKIGILGSGRGSNAEALLKSWSSGQLGRAEPRLILSDVEDARILELGARFGVEAKYVDPGRFRTKLEGEGEDRYIETLQSADVDVVVLAGFMRVIKAGFLEAFPRRIINLHPSLLPSFKGLHAIEQAWDYGVRVTGCSVHLVTGELDGGPILDQAVVRIEEGMALPDLETAVHEAEHRLLPSVIERLSTGELQWP